MTISEEELNAKRLRVAHLRKEISSLRTEGSITRVAAEQEITSRALDDEIARLESQVVDAAKSAGGTVEDAIAAMERAAEVERMATPQKEDEPVQTHETDDLVVSVNPDLRSVDGGESSSPHLDVVDNPNSEVELEGHGTDETDEEVSR